MLDNYEERVKAAIKDAISTIQIKSGDVIIYRFSPEELPEDIRGSMDAIQDVFPENQIIALCRDEDMLIASPTEAIDMLEKMIAKIKILHDTPKPGIILPD